MRKRASQLDDCDLGDVLGFMRTLWAVDHGLQLRSKRMQRELGITGPQRLALRIIGQFPDISAGDLAAILHTHPSTLSGVLRRLEDRGALRRRASPKDARRAMLRLTADGRRLNQISGNTVEDAVALTLQKVPRAQARKTQALLHLLAQALGG